MAKAKLKTSRTDAVPANFVTQVEHPRRRADAETLLAFFAEVTGMPARMWGDSIVGFGRYQYRYESGREGEFFITGFSPRKQNLTIYIMPGYQDLSAMLSRLGKHKLGRSCLYDNKLDDIDMDVLREIVEFGVEHLRANYETSDD